MEKRNLIIGFVILVVLVLIFVFYFYKSSNNPENICINQGGRWGSWSMLPQKSCNLPTSDAGKICYDKSQCETFCKAKDSAKVGLNDSGNCYGWTMAVDECSNQILNGIVSQKECA